MSKKATENQQALVAQLQTMGKEQAAKLFGKLTLDQRAQIAEAIQAVQIPDDVKAAMAAKVKHDIANVPGFFDRLMDGLSSLSKVLEEEDQTTKDDDDND